MKALLRAIALLAIALRCAAADPIPFMLQTNGVIYGRQTNFFLINGELMTNALVALGYSSGVGGGGSGTVTSVGATSSVSGLSFSGTVTNAGTLALTGTLGLLSGGTGATNAAGARAALELGSAATNAAAAFEPAGVAAADITDSTAAGRSMLTALDAPAQRSLLDLASLYVPIINPTTTGTFTHGGTNAIITSSNAVFNVGKANALVIGTNGNVGIGGAINTSFGFNVSGAARITGGIYGTATADATSGQAGAAFSTDGGIFSAKAVSASKYLIRSNAPSTAAARGANTLVQEFNTNQWRAIATGPTTNEMVLMTVNTNGIMALNGLRFNQSELQPFSSVTNYVADFDGPTQQTILVTNLIANFLHATNVAAGKMRSFIIRAGTNATVTVVLPRPLWECSTNVATLAANQSLTVSLTGFGPDSNTNVNATVGPIYSR